MSFSCHMRGTCQYSNNEDLLYLCTALSNLPLGHGHFLMSIPLWSFTLAEHGFQNTLSMSFPNFTRYWPSFHSAENGLTFMLDNIFSYFDTGKAYKAYTYKALLPWLWYCFWHYWPPATTLQTCWVNFMKWLTVVVWICLITVVVKFWDKDVW